MWVTLWNAKFFILCGVIFLVSLQEKFEIDHSFHEVVILHHITTRQEQSTSCSENISVVFSQPGESPILSSREGATRIFPKKDVFAWPNKEGGWHFFSLPWGGDKNFSSLALMFIIVTSSIILYAILSFLRTDIPKNSCRWLLSTRRSATDRLSESTNSLWPLSPVPTSLWPVTCVTCQCVTCDLCHLLVCDLWPVPTSLWPFFHYPCRLRDGLRDVLNISKLGNQYLQANKPWALVKEGPAER